MDEEDRNLEDGEHDADSWLLMILGREWWHHQRPIDSDMHHTESYIMIHR